MDELISRQAAIDAARDWYEGLICGSFKGLEKRLRALPSAQPDLDEWCYDCKEYDQERHCCPRFNRVIRETAEEVRQNAQPEPRWIPCSERLPEKIGEYLCQESQGFQYCETYLGSGKWRIADYYSGKVVAWMPLPEPYREERR